MRILLTNSRLEHRAGSELYIAEVAAWLGQHGHVPIVYASRLGQVADELRAAGITVVSGVDEIDEPPEVIHAQHHLAAMSALARFPLVPAVGFCHGVIPWQEAPVTHPAIRRYVAVSSLTRERVLEETGVSPDIIEVVPNFVEVPRYVPRGPLPSSPRRALVFSNSAKVGGWVDGVVTACQARGIDVDIVGLASGNPVTEPETVLPRYDLVFARGRSALEAMAAGVAVVLCDMEGCGPFVTPDDFARLQAANFGKAVIGEPHHGPYLGRQIDRYDPALAHVSTEIVRSTLDRDRVVPRLAEIYREAVAAVQLAPHTLEEARRAEQAYLAWLDRNYPRPVLESVERLEQQYHHARQLADRTRVERDRARLERDRLRAEVEGLRSRYRRILVPTGSRRHRLLRAARGWMLGRLGRPRAR